MGCWIWKCGKIWWFLPLTGDRINWSGRNLARKHRWGSGLVCQIWPWSITSSPNIKNYANYRFLPTTCGSTNQAKWNLACNHMLVVCSCLPYLTLISSGSGYRCPPWHLYLLVSSMYLTAAAWNSNLLKIWPQVTSFMQNFTFCVMWV